MTFQLRFKSLFLHVAMAMCGAALLASHPADASTSKNKSATPAKKAAESKSKSAKASVPKSAPAKSSAKPAAKTTAKTAKSPAQANGTASAKSSQCKTVRVKTAKGMRNQRVCNTSAPEPALQNSPIKENALTAGPAAATAGTTELKARTVPDRAYAVDGETFFHQGRKYRLQGIPAGALAVGGEHAKQKLQMMLDSGNLSVEPMGVDASGVATAVVRINGRDVVDTLGRDVPRSMRAGASSSSQTLGRPTAPALPAPVTAVSGQRSAEPASAPAAAAASSSSDSEWQRGPVFEPGDGISPGAVGD
jgi:hypothetical protein